MRAKTVSLSLLSATLLLGMTVTGLTGCGTKKTDETVRTKNVKYDRNLINNDVNRYGTRSVNDGLHTRSSNTTMGNLRHSKEISDKIVTLKEVNSANVMLTDHSAYVAVSIKDHNKLRGTSTNLNRTRGTGISNLGNDGNMMGVGAPSITGTGTGTGMGTTVRNQTGGNYPANINNEYGTNSTNSNGLMRGLTTTPTPSSNVVKDEDQYMTQEVKDKIADLVKKSDPSVKNVYVSANPEFVERVGNFVTDVSNGHPISGIVDEFQSLVNRIFPTASGTHVTNEPVNSLNKMGR
ncbi:YhcN/YlaJ family sporulation lipoprotein [Paenibacillus macquariensis]|uniref:Sporulation lipoprotein, YhcN/YlaJ family n=1 Tax=Paenibacillus macquariensis TaxID=948756 RepID=A0ABY1JTD5_9BACL|nr:YhcN/YlaJ family sporulation lipoprotein [Paenibacillus macquariensis]MEC0093062.1 YhcN/YlaJ family sporulation lipoprotein [Paenibacillus macquariensis]OAB36411.1 hypothetical protein PMSM_08205 [Paenibacillus macquariensis subsp. macquariensis]SIQ71844.1 sporulation lipoprotein, YhcN/YlaJ family [Paenibacillus macquariensis]